MNFRQIINDSIKEMNEDVSIIRLTFITTFFHSLIVIILIIVNLNDLLSKNYENWLYFWKVAEYFIQEVNRNKIVTIFVIIASVLFIAYSIVYPIWQSALIHYISERRWLKSAIKKWIRDFFPMFEFSFLSLLTSPIVFYIYAFRTIAINNNTSFFMRTLLIAWFLAMSYFNMLKSYTRYFISLENQSLYESLKNSIKTNLKDTKSWFKYMRTQTILLINFSINIMLMLWIPIILIYLCISWWIMDMMIVKISMYIIFFVMVLTGAYMSNFVRAFFAYFWYKIYIKQKV
jgi:hypothetical protein